MAEARGGGGGEKGKKILSFASKKARRVQQKMLQKVGQAEKTTDDNYTEFVVNFNKQQLAAARLQKELSKYSQSLKGLNQSTKSLMDLWMELYEPDWKGHNEMKDILQQQSLLWEDILSKITNELLEPLQMYVAKFPETKKLVEKRERKIVDYDYRKRELEATRQSKKVTEVKIQQAEEVYHEAKRAFDEVTDVLYEELPLLFDSRIQFYATFFRNMASVGAKFHEEMFKLDTSYYEVMNKLHEEAESGVHTSRKERIPISDGSLSNLSPAKNSPADEDGSSISNEEEGDNLSESFASAQGGDSTPSRTPSGKETPTTSHPSSKPPKPLRSESTFTNEENLDKLENGSLPSTPIEQHQPPPKPSSISSDPKEPEDESPEEPVQVSEKTLPEQPEEKETSEEVTEKESKEEMESREVTEKVEVENKEEVENNREEPNESQSPPAQVTEAETTENPISDLEAGSMNVLYKVVATHPYIGEDEDELSFDKGDIICVIPFINSDDEEDGWKMGFVEGTTKKGLFPENFTKAS